MRRNARVVGNFNPRTKTDHEVYPRGLSVEELAWWLLCQVEIRFNELLNPGKKGCPGVTIKHWLGSASSAKHSDEDMKDVMGALTYAA